MPVFFPIPNEYGTYQLDHSNLQHKTHHELVSSVLNSLYSEQKKKISERLLSIDFSNLTKSKRVFLRNQ